MARALRRKSESGIYHVMMRGVNKLLIFVNDADKMRFLDILTACKEISGFELYAYCLMGNHVHLLIGVKDEPLEKIVKRINNRYVYWFNLAHDRVGHMFQDRFKSEPVDDDNYFLTVLRYILQNPVKAGFCRKLSDYEWSSYADYKAENKTGITDTSFALGIASRKDLLDFLEWENEDKCLDDDNMPPRRPGEAESAFRRITGCKTVEQFQEYNSKMQQELIRKCRAEGISIRKLSELTGITCGIIRTVK